MLTSQRLAQILQHAAQQEECWGRSDPTKTFILHVRQLAVAYSEAETRHKADVARIGNLEAENERLSAIYWSQNGVKAFGFGREPPSVASPGPTLSPGQQPPTSPAVP